MSNFKTALEIYRTKKLGENLHMEYNWNNKDIEENIVQLYFQLVRTNEKEVINNLADLFINIYKVADDTKKIILLKILVNTRDIIKGKGEKDLSYAMLYKLSFIEPELTKKIIKSFVILDNCHSIGSWADIKIIWSQYNWNDDFTQFFTKLINNQVKKEEHKTRNISLVAKWVPRETNKHGNLFKILAEDYFHNYILSAKTSESLIKAKKKCYRNYGKLITKLSRNIDVTQIKQCEKRYSEIDFNNVTSITINKQKNAFLNKQKIDCQDRKKCAERFNSYIETCFNNSKNVKGERVSVYDFIKSAINYNNSKIKNNNLINLLNSQWKDSLKSLDGKLGNFIAMVDTSGSMECDNCVPLYNAIGLGIRVAEKSVLGKRILSFNTKTSWISLENEENLTDMVAKIMSNPVGMNTNLMDSLDLILSMILYRNIHPCEIPRLTLCIFSDMQVDYQYKEGISETLWESINKKYHDTGIKYYGVPFNTPHILFWNMRSTKGFPVITKQKNVSMLSGFSLSILDIFCNKGYNNLENLNSYDILLNILKTKRYRYIDKLFYER